MVDRQKPQSLSNEQSKIAQTDPGKPRDIARDVVAAANGVKDAKDNLAKLTANPIITDVPLSYRLQLAERMRQLTDLAAQPGGLEALERNLRDA